MTSIPLRIYYACKYTDKEQAKRTIKALEADGHVITHNWPEMEQTDRSEEAMGEYAQLDLQGVRHAELVIAEMTDKDYAYKGTWTELGGALLTERQVAIVSPFTNKVDGAPLTRNVFFWHPAIFRCATIEEALAWAIGQKRKAQEANRKTFAPATGK